MNGAIKRRAAILLIVMLVPLSAFAHGYRGTRTNIWIGPGWSPWWGYPAPYYYSYSPPPVIIQQPATEYYFQAPPQQKEQEPAYWYYCRKPDGYYPYVKTCPDGWLKVVPTIPEENGEQK